jgi:hypothetical protein
MKLKDWFFISCVGLLVISLAGCDAFVRKFTRKSKKGDLPREELVLSPEEYHPPQISKEERYRQYYLYWKSWHDELLTSITERRNSKKQLDCAQEAIKQLEQMRGMLGPDKQKQLDVYLAQFNDIRDEVAKDIYNAGAPERYNRTERIKMNIQQHFSYAHIKNSLL